MSDWQKANPDKVAAAARRARAKRKAFVEQYLVEHPCVDCGEDDPIVLEFDHVMPIKWGRVGELSNQTCAAHWKLLEEISRCEVRCCNCHRRVTVKRKKEGASLSEGAA